MSLALEKSKQEIIDAQTLVEVVKEFKVDERCEEFLVSYKEAAITSLQEMEDPTLKGLMRRVIGKIFNDIEIRGWCSEYEEGNVAGREVGSSSAS